MRVLFSADNTLEAGALYPTIQEKKLEPEFDSSRFGLTQSDFQPCPSPLLFARQREEEKVASNQHDHSGPTAAAMAVIAVMKSERGNTLSGLIIVKKRTC